MLEERSDVSPPTSVADVFESFLCDDCLRQLLTRSDAPAIQTLLWIPEVLPDHTGTHVVCPHCYDLRRADRVHECLVSNAGVTLSIGGWASPMSEVLRRALRRGNRDYEGVVAKALTELLTETPLDGQILVPVPMTGTRGTDPLAHVLGSITERVNAKVVQAVGRKKTHSTRKSSAGKRRRIAATEYFLFGDHVNDLRNADVIVVDDNVTTGSTIEAITQLVRSVGPRSVSAVSFDKTISARLRQRLQEHRPLTCPHL